MSDPANSDGPDPMLGDVFADHCDVCREWALKCRWMRDLRSHDEMVVCPLCRGLDRFLINIEADHRPARS